MIWLSPVHRSPHSGNGYGYGNGNDTGGCRDIDPMFGRLGEFDAHLVEFKNPG